MSGEGNESDREPVWLSHFKEVIDARFDNVDQKFEFTDKALDLQAQEYARRLDDLNHAHERVISVQAKSVSLDKYETNSKAEEQARKVALERLDERLASLDKQVNEKLDNYITKAEARQAEIDQALAAQEGAAAEATRAAEKQGRESADLAMAQHRKTNRNLVIAGLILTAIIGISNWFGSANPPNPAPASPPVTTTTLIP